MSLSPVVKTRYEVFKFPLSIYGAHLNDMVGEPDFDKTDVVTLVYLVKSTLKPLTLPPSDILLVQQGHIYSLVQLDKTLILFNELLHIN